MSPKTSVRPEDVFELLKAGNRRFMQGASVHPNIDSQRRVELSQGQSPFAVILGCSDSRIPPEIIFDRGLGDLFVIRVAGNIVDQAVMGSVVYGVCHLGCPLVVVLGHESCGAVTAAYNFEADPESESPSLLKIIEKIRENTPGALSQHEHNGSDITAAIQENVRTVVKQLETEQVLAAFIAEKKARIVGAYYNLRSGNVTWR
ncbi:carbonic anhydrase [bacterium]|nr:carbonic anhydrase [bacterium]